MMVIEDRIIQAQKDTDSNYFWSRTKIKRNIISVQIIFSAFIKLNLIIKKSNLGPVNFEGAAARIDVSTVQCRFCTLGILNVGVLHHCLNSALAEDDNSLHITVRFTYFVDDILNSDDLIQIQSIDYQVML